MEHALALTNGKIYNGFNVFENHALLLKNGLIDGIISSDDVPKSYRIIDVGGAYISAGLIDLQVYGAGQDLFSAELTVESLERIEQNLLLQGCTSFMLTLATNTLDVFEQAISVFKQTLPRVALGLHLEGPFLNPKKRGAHPEELIIPATVSVIENLLENAEGNVKMMTIAPECVDLSCVEALLKRGVVLSAGHSSATYEEGVMAFEHGVVAVTHLWNAMSPFFHRDVGLPGAAFNHPKVWASIIADGIHVDFKALKISKQLMGERLFLITDAVAACDKGIYKHVFSEDHYTLPDGTLSGSALSMLQAVQNCVEKVDIPLEEALRMATLYPSRVIGCTDIGNLNKGSRANVIVFSADFVLEQIYFDGSPVL